MKSEKSVMAARPSVRRRIVGNAVVKAVSTAALALAAMWGDAAHAGGPLQEMTYLLPAPQSEIAFAPLMIAQYKHYYADEGLSVRFVTVQGGAEVGKQLASGNGDLGGGLGDTPIVLRQNGIPVKAVALFGGQALHQFVTRADENITGPAALKGKTVTVMSYQDTSFYATLAVLAKGSLTRQDVSVQAAGPSGIWQLLAQGRADAMVGTPDWAASAEAAGAKLTWHSTDAYFPGMAQAVLASDRTIATRPDLVRKFVRASLKAMAEIERDPAAAAKDYAAAVPSWQARQPFVTRVLVYYAQHVYPGQSRIGAFDPVRVEKLQDFYLAQKIIRTRVDAKDLFTNEFVE
ncbi:ABC transporter substrate-binding protein [Paraburkholderia sp. J63]|uniref:ABC transporter substrate-binding protein n=1 Tax=Paraburkholderia sp. J63 TaxID=2805434 RepID=UPI002ABE8540|nr:ABC transporter substrate-binding protein [Paraburkholderia sp. J63]